jgi:tetratricopeptide (TPR) repeat protein
MPDDLVDFTPPPSVSHRPRIPDYHVISNNASYVKLLAGIILIAEFIVFAIQIVAAILILMGSLDARGYVDSHAPGTHGASTGGRSGTPMHKDQSFITPPADNTSNSLPRHKGICMKLKITGSLLLSALLVVGCKTTPTNTVAADRRLPDPEETHPDAPITANTRFAAGQVAESQGDMQRAITQYEAAARLDHTASVPLLRLGMIYTRQGEFDLAVGAWNRYIQATKGDASGYCDLGYTLELAQRFAESEAAYKTAIQKAPNNEVARVDYGLMLARAGRMQAAAEQLGSVLPPAEVHYNLASVLESEGKKSAARAEYQEAIRLDPDMKDAQTRLAGIDTN